MASDLPSAKTCGACGTPLGRKNQSGYCKAHFSMWGRPPDHGERVRQGLKRKYAADPVAKAQMRVTATANLFLPQAIDARKQTARRIRLWEIGSQHARTPEARQKAAKTRRANALAWCPPELWDEYLRLNRHCHIRKEEAQRIILEQHEKNMREFRRSIGA